MENFQLVTSIFRKTILISFPCVPFRNTNYAVVVCTFVLEGYQMFVCSLKFFYVVSWLTNTHNEKDPTPILINEMTAKYSVFRPGRSLAACSMATVFLVKHQFILASHAKPSMSANPWNAPGFKGCAISKVSITCPRPMNLDLFKHGLKVQLDLI